MDIKEDLISTGSSLFFTQAADQFGINLNKEAREKFIRYSRELLFWNERVNLISLKNPAELWAKHFLDSLSAGRMIGDKSCKLLDMGAGAGLPGLPLKISFPALRLWAVESSRKKASFLKHMVRLLDLPDTEIINARIETLLENERYINNFDVVISRAAFKLPKLLKLSSSFLRPQGLTIAMKGPGVFQQEMTDAEAVASRMGFSLISSLRLKLGWQETERVLLAYKKIIV